LTSTFIATWNGPRRHLHLSMVVSVGVLATKQALIQRTRTKKIAAIAAA